MLTNHKDRRKRFCFYLLKLTIAPINLSPRGFDFRLAYESAPIRVIYDSRNFRNFHKMKIDTKSVNILSKSDTLAILPLESKPVKYTRAQTALFKCRTTPTQADSPTYEVVIKILDGSETLREAITWNKQVEMLRNGLSLDTAAKMEAIILKVTEGHVQTVFKEEVNRLRVKARVAAAEAARDAAVDAPTGIRDYEAVMAQALDPATDDMVNKAIHKIVAFMTPTHGLQRVKRYLRRYCRKPADMTVREFWANFQRINNEEIPNMPPLYDATQSLKRDELIDILLYSLPKSWQGEMNKQNYDPFGGSVQDLIDFAERMETAEALDAKASGRKQESSAKKSSDKKRSSSSNYKGKGGKLYCLLHGEGGHTTDDCFLMKSQAKKMKSDHPSNSNSGSKNKTWKKNDYDVKKYVKKELQVLMKQAQKGKKRDLNAFAALAEESDKNSKSDDDGSDDASMHSARSAMTNSSGESMNVIQKMEQADLKDDEEFDLNKL